MMYVRIDQRWQSIDAAGHDSSRINSLIYRILAKIHYSGRITSSTSSSERELIVDTLAIFGFVVLRVEIVNMVDIQQPR